MASQVKGLLSPSPFVQESVQFRAFDGNDGKGYIYVMGEALMRQPNSNYYKVGRTEHLMERKNQLQRGNPRDVYCLRYAIVSDMVEAERAAHEAVKQFRAGVEGGTEWHCVDQRSFQSFLDEIAKAIHRWRLE